MFVDRELLSVVFLQPRKRQISRVLMLSILFYGRDPGNFGRFVTVTNGGCFGNPIFALICSSSLSQNVTNTITGSSPWPLRPVIKSTEELYIVYMAQTFDLIACKFGFCDPRLLTGGVRFLWLVGGSVSYLITFWVNRKLRLMTTG